MNVLVLSSSTGQGHNVAADAIVEEFVSHGVECVHRDVLTFADEGNVPRFVKDYIVKDGYDDLVMRHPQVWAKVFGIGEAISSPRHRSPMFFANKTYAGNLGAYIEDEGIDTVICTHMFPAQALTALMDRGLKVASYAVATDYLCLPFWEECTIDHYLVSHRDVISEFVGRGISSDKVTALGLPVAHAFRNPPSREQARAELGLFEEGTVYLILTGSMGFGHIEDIPEMLSESDPDSQVIVVTGSNADLRAALDGRYGDAGWFHVLGYTDRMVACMAAADVVLTKPGGLSSTEVACVARPLVHTPAIPGFESRNATFFQDHRMSLSADDERTCADDALLLAHNERLAKSMCGAQRANIDPYASERIFEFVCRNAQEDLASRQDHPLGRSRTFRWDRIPGHGRSKVRDHMVGHVHGVKRLGVSDDRAHGHRHPLGLRASSARSGKRRATRVRHRGFGTSHGKRR